ncbi:5-formyltetrahydrofolate cyclo-ligase [Noviherbaspirillum sedimenti]|uniref:5-formyltetrahydrofolate cyclo-ligase n=1 Tax=Noviherbaspirillum sedimenti TaxID=2320865 RepID=A0A3A3GMA2_9BURK|nr:5-formyltetrahydrofolate cyclo-ligase [Noviherbaspirillum sedimenti]RJG03426.1 5-formyltetrahydrofolate cyclo-ligase [Noviherbaspirillum sedimenti]
MADFPPDKNRLRQDLIAQRQAISPPLRAEWDLAIGKHLSRLLAAQPARAMGVFWPMRSEPDLRALFEEWVTAGVQLALPVVIDPDLPLKFLAWAPGDALAKDAMGVWVPANADREVAPDLLLVPCVGYNQECFRLGYGGGFYDRTLATAPRPRAIGVAYACARADFAVEAHDIALDGVITEAGIEN